MKRVALAWLLLALGACTQSDPVSVVQPDPYVDGPYGAVEIPVAEGEQGAPKRGLLYSPTVAGRYPLVQFQHGFTSLVENYQFLLARLASHGFIVFAPQMYDTGGNPSTAPGIPAEVADAAIVASWFQAHADSLVASQTGVHANAEKLGLAGHSRGGQVAWRMLVDAGVDAKAYAGVDPVDGDAPPFATDGPGPLVTATPTHFGFPVHVLGTGLGATGGPFACAPSNRNYTLFQDAALDGSYTVLADEHGHADMLDPDCPDCRAACASNPATGMPEFSAGQLVAYFALQLNRVGDAARYLTDVAGAPVPASVQ